jgi:transmembrane sensor
MPLMTFKSDQTGKDIDFATSRIQQNAADWFAKLRNSRATEEDRHQFEAWLAADPKHPKAYRDIETFWNTPQFVQTLAAIPLSSQQNKLTKHSYRIALPSVAACFIIATFILRPNLDCLQADHCTQIGEIKNIQLSDGSNVILNSQSAINVNLSNNARHVELVQGEALFEVQRNPALPFVVTSHFGQTRVLGTQFVVREDKQSDTISVIQGIVAVSQGNLRPALLKVNDQITINADQASPVQRIAATSISAWTKGHLVVNSTNLETVIKEIGRYRKGTVFIKNKHLKALKVSGRFDINHPDKALEALEETLPITLYRLTPWLVVIA